MAIRLIGRLLCLAGVLVVVACGGSGIEPTTTGPDTTEPAAQSTTLTEAPESGASPLPAEGTEFEPGVRYFVDPDGDPSTSMTVEFSIDQPGWFPVIGAAKENLSGIATPGYVAVNFATIDRVASAACHDTTWVEVDDDAEEWARGLAEIDDWITVEPLTELSAFGYSGYHLELQVSEEYDSCDDQIHEDAWDGWEGPTFSRYYQGAGQVVEFWVLDVSGNPLLIEATWFDVSETYLDDLARVIDSITISP